MPSDLDAVVSALSLKNSRCSDSWPAAFNKRVQSVLQAIVDGKLPRPKGQDGIKNVARVVAGWLAKDGLYVPGERTLERELKARLEALRNAQTKRR
jgi:hypothetical protein